jgi:hypothetical protein
MLHYTHRGLGMMAFTGLFTGFYLFLEDLRESRDVANAGASGAVTGTRLQGLCLTRRP